MASTRFSKSTLLKNMIVTRNIYFLLPSESLARISNAHVQSSSSVLCTILIRIWQSGMVMTHWKSSAADARRIEIELLPPELQGRSKRLMICRAFNIGGQWRAALGVASGFFVDKSGLHGRNNKVPPNFFR
jgi:hypothetical protein